MNFLKLIRYQNLLLIALMQVIFRYGFLKLQKIDLALANWQFGLLVLATVLIAASGYIINDILDQETDAINRPNTTIIGNTISEDFAFNLYIGINIVALLLGYYLSNVIHKPTFLAAFIIPVILLYLYATSFKKIAVIGNLVVALVLGLSVIIIGFFDILPATDANNKIEMMTLLFILLDYTVFAVLINFIREIVKDLEDVDGDYNQGMSTLAIVFGKERTAKTVSILAFTATVIVLWYINKNLMNSKLYFATVYCVLSIISPLLFVMIKSWNAKSKKEFRLLSSVLKVIIFFGIISALVISLNINYNVKG
ncbi:geranylgeranylglycerol-phosphate geranylgeranyltransferase [Flavobacterium sp.]